MRISDAIETARAMTRWREAVLSWVGPCIAGMAAVLWAGFAAAQAPDKAPAPPSAAAEAQDQLQPAPATPNPAAPGFRPGLVDAVGEMLQSGLGAWNEGLKSARDTISRFGGETGAVGAPAQPAGEAAKEPAAAPAPSANAPAASAPVPNAAAAPAENPAVPTAPRLPVGGIVSGRQQCVIAPNGAPDCRTAAETMCKANGYTTGSSIDFQTADKCSGRLLAAGPKPVEITCRPEHFVTKALCQ
jgi:hypothetical protein